MKISDTDVINNLKKIISVVGVDSFNNHQRANALINDFFTGSENTTTKRFKAASRLGRIFYPVFPNGKSDTRRKMPRYPLWA